MRYNANELVSFKAITDERFVYFGYRSGSVNYPAIPAGGAKPIIECLPIA